ncbi:hypothetical protein ABBQ38_000824 [Trebouxia sp. C0009 RCD-2024]
MLSLVPLEQGKCPTLHLVYLLVFGVTGCNVIEARVIYVLTGRALGSWCRGPGVACMFLEVFCIPSPSHGGRRYLLLGACCNVSSMKPRDYRRGLVSDFDAVYPPNFLSYIS